MSRALTKRRKFSKDLFYPNSTSLEVEKKKKKEGAGRRMGWYLPLEMQGWSREA
jgi:hypothetical protein